MRTLSLRLLVFPFALLALPVSVALLSAGCGAPAAHPNSLPQAREDVGGLVAFLTPPSPVELDPKTLLEEARALQEVGEYQQAKDRYRSILAAAPASAEAAEARYNLGVIAFVTGDFSRAVDAFTQFRERHPDHPKARIALFWLAQSQQGTAAGPEALAAYEEFLRFYPQVEAEVRARRGQILAKGKDPAAVLTELKAAASAGGASRELQRRYADLLLSQGDGQGAASVYRELFASASSDWARAELLYLVAQGLKAAGDGRYLDTLAQIVRSYPSSYYAKLALDGITTPLSDSPLQGGRGLMERLGITPYEEGRVRYYQREDAAALEAFERQRRSLPDHGQTPWARYRIALVYERLDRNEEALGELTALIREYGSGELGEEALWEKASLLDYLGRYGDASASYAAFSSRFGGSKRAREAQFKRGLSDYRGGALRSAAQVWGSMEQEPKGSVLGGRVAFWLGKALSALGDQAGAARALEQAQEPRPGRYYALRAEARGRELTPLWKELGSPAMFTEGIPPQGHTEAQLWIRGWAGHGVSASGETSRSALESPEVQRGVLLSEMGLRAEATEEFRSAVRAHASDPTALYTLARFLHDRHEHAAAIMAASMIWEAAPVLSPGQLPVALLKVLYPNPYTPRVVQYAREWDIDPLLLYALMRQESLFNPGATSAASAKGLTQVIPSTGQEIAKSLGLKGFSSEDLYRPAVSIRFGAYYLSKQLQNLGQDAYFAVAAYNAGGGSALRWMGNDRRADPDLFVESIDYGETSNYVRVVMENYAYYVKLYGVR